MNSTMTSKLKFTCLLLALQAVLLLQPGASLNAQPRTQRQFELKPETEEFWKLFDRDAKLEKVAGDFGFLEGPVWDPRGFLYVSDETGNRISRVFPDGRVEEALKIGDPDGSTLDRKHRLITTSDTMREVWEVQDDGTHRVIADRFEGKRLNSPNDIVLGPDGALYFTDPTLDLPKGEAQEIPFQGVYRLAADGSLRVLAQDVSQPNGLAFSPDGRRLYVSDTPKREIRVYDVTTDGTLANGRLFGKAEGPPRSGVPDGIRVDRAGNVFVTGPLGVWVWSSEGRHLGTVVLPENAANLGWGDADFRTLYFAASTSVYRLKTKAQGFVPYAASPQ